MVNQNVKYNIKYTFEKLNEAYGMIKDIPDTKNYHLTLGNVNEVHLLKNDATKAVFLGTLFEDDNADKTEEAKKIWNAIHKYFTSHTSVAPESAEEDTPVATVEPKKTKAKKQTKEVQKIEVPEVPEVDEADEDSAWVNSIL